MLLVNNNVYQTFSQFYYYYYFFFFIVIHGKTSVYWKTSSCKYLKIPHKLKNVEGWKGQMLTSKCKFTLYRFSSSLILNLSNVASHNYSGVPNPAHSRTRKNHSVRTSHKRIFAFHAPRAIISSAILTRSLPTAKSIKKKKKEKYVLPAAVRRLTDLQVVEVKPARDGLELRGRGERSLGKSIFFRRIMQS